MKKIAMLAAAGLLAAALTVPARQAAADGPECNLTSHCYGIAQYASGNIAAVGVDLWTDCLHLDTPLTDDAVHEMWLWTNAASPAATWIESGYIRGIVAGGDPENWFRWYWAEYTGTTFYSHFAQWASVDQWKNVSFYHYPTNQWGVYIGGTYIGTSAQYATTGTYVQVGAETTEPKVYSHGKSRNLQWETGGSWSWGSPAGSGGTAGVYSVSASGAAMEQTSLQNMCSPAPLAPKQAAATAPSSADLLQAARAVASQYGEKAPTGVQAVTTTRKAAQRAVGAASVDGDQATYLVQMQGSFVGRAPKGAPLPRGNTMTVTVDATTGEVTDLSLGTTRQDLKKLGAVKAL